MAAAAGGITLPFQTSPTQNFVYYENNTNAPWDVWVEWCCRFTIAKTGSGEAPLRFHHLHPSGHWETLAPGQPLTVPIDTNTMRFVEIGDWDAQVIVDNLWEQVTGASDMHYQLVSVVGVP